MALFNIIIEQGRQLGRVAKAVTIGLTAFDWRRISFPSTLLFNTASNSAAAVLKADQVEHQVSNKVDRVVPVCAPYTYTGRAINPINSTH